MIAHLSSPTRIAFLCLTLHFMAYDRLSAQRYLTTFGPVQELTTNKAIHGLLSGDFNGDGLQDLAAYGGTSIVVYYQQLPPHSWQSVTLKVDRPIRTATVARCNDDRIDDIVIATDPPGSIEVLLGRPRKGLVVAWKKDVPEPFSSLAVANVNNDRKADILLWGEKQLGVQVFLGNGNGTFRVSPVLFGEYSISALAVDDMNDDGIADIIVGNWISNELLLYTGFGNMKFSDPAVISLTSEPSFVTTSYFDGDPMKDIIVVSGSNRSIQVFSGDGLGGFKPSAPVFVGAPPSVMMLADVNGDGRPDIGILCAQGRYLAVGLNDGKGVVEELMKFAGGKTPSGFTFFTHARTGRTNAAIVDSSSHKIRIAFNASVTDSSIGRTEYMTGLGPSGVATSRVSRDGREDAFVGNAASGTVSYFHQLADGSYDGQMSFSTLTKPTEISYVWGNDTMAVLLLTDPSEHLSSIAEIQTSDFSHRSFALPLREESDLVSVDADPATGTLQIYALEQESRHHSLSLIEFEQIAPSRFIERTCTPALPVSLSACVMTRRSPHALQGLCYVRYNAKTKSEDVYEMAQEKPRQFTAPVLAFSVSVPESCGVLAWSTDLNADGVDDLILNLREPANVLLCSFRQKDSTVSAPTVRMKDISIRSEKYLQVGDATGDGIADIIFENNITKSLYYLPGPVTSSALPRVRLISTEGLGGFALGHAPGDSSVQLLVTEQLQGLFKVVIFSGGGN